jgi:disulfide bond formation protein DsbB
MSPLIEKILSLPLAAKLLFCANVGSLLFALTMQFGFGVLPCVLCLWQRVPYGSAAVLSLMALLWKPYGRQTIVILGLCVVAYLTGMGLAIFHTGVELHWWLGTSGCAVQPLHGASPEDLRQALLQTIAPRCDEISWTIFGFSMANLNIAASLALAFFSAAVAAKRIEE